MAKSHQFHKGPWLLHLIAATNTASVTASDGALGLAGTSINWTDKTDEPEWLGTFRLIAAAPAMYELLREGLIGQKSDGSFTDDTWLTRVRDLLEDEIDMDEEAS